MEEKILKKHFKPLVLNLKIYYVFLELEISYVIEQIT